MRASSAAILGVFCFLVAGFVRDMGPNSSDPELILAGFYGLAACGAVGVLAGGVASGIRLATEDDTRAARHARGDARFCR